MYQPDKLSPDVTVPLNDVQKALVEARALIERGWCQKTVRTFIDGHLRYCAIGAMIEVSGIGEICTLARPFEDATGLSSTSEIGHWNDDPSRTKADVVAAFDRAIEIAGR